MCNISVYYGIEFIVKQKSRKENAMDKRNNTSLLSKIIKSVLTFCVIFVLCILLLPLLLLKTPDPNSFISASIILVLALSSMFCGISTQLSFGKNKLLTGLVVGIIISGVLFLISSFFAREERASVVQLLFLYGTPVVFSLIGASIGAKRKKGRKRKNRK